MSSYASNSTCMHRYNALKELCSNADSINVDDFFSYSLSNRIRNKLFKCGFNVPLNCNPQIFITLFKAVSEKKYDIVWVDKGIVIDDKMLKKVKELSPGTLIIGYSPDDMAQRHNQSCQFLSSLPYYDLFVTTKSYLVDELKSLGTKNVLFIENSYNEKFHFPRELTDSEYKQFHTDVSFIGAFEKERGESILFLAENGIPVRVYSNPQKWRITHQNIQLFPPIFNDSYCKAISAAKINLCFLRKINRDLQTTRSIEIPACGGFMLAERTKEHLGLFKENEEAVFFDSNQELLSKVKYYLAHEEERVHIAQAGLQRCINSGYSNKARLKKVLDYIETIH